MSIQLTNLSHAWGHHMPEWPSHPGVNVLVKKFHAKDGVYQTEFEGIMHRGTHMDAPRHVTENTPDLLGYPLWRFFGTGVAVSIPNRSHDKPSRVSQPVQPDGDDRVHGVKGGTRFTHRLQRQGRAC